MPNKQGMTLLWNVQALLLCYFFIVRSFRGSKTTRIVCIQRELFAFWGNLIFLLKKTKQEKKQEEEEDAR